LVKHQFVRGGVHAQWYADERDVRERLRGYLDSGNELQKFQLWGKPELLLPRPAGDDGLPAWSPCLDELGQPAPECEGEAGPAKKSPRRRTTLGKQPILLEQVNRGKMEAPGSSARAEIVGATVVELGMAGHDGWTQRRVQWWLHDNTHADTPMETLARARLAVRTRRAFGHGLMDTIRVCQRQLRERDTRYERFRRAVTKFEADCARWQDDKARLTAEADQRRAENEALQAELMRTRALLDEVLTTAAGELEQRALSLLPREERMHVDLFFREWDRLRKCPANLHRYSAEMYELAFILQKERGLGMRFSDMCSSCQARRRCACTSRIGSRRKGNG
jgi:hypothetical protein